MHGGRIDQRLRQAKGVRHLLRQGACRLAVLEGLLRKAQGPQLPGQIAARRHAEVQAVAHRQGPVRLRVIERQGLRVVGLGRGRLAPIEQDRPQLIVGEQAQRRVGLGLGQAEQLLPELGRRLYVPSVQIILHQPPQHREELRRVAELRTQLPRPGVGAFHLGGGMPLGGTQRRAQAPPGGPAPAGGVPASPAASSARPSPCVRCATASAYAEPWSARWPARCQ